LHHANALKLRVVNHKHAAQIATHARAIERHKRKLVRLHAKIDVEAIAIAGPDYADHHIVGFDECTAPSLNSRSTTRAALQSMALDLWTSLNWPTLWPISPAVLPRALCRLNCRLNNDENKIEINQCPGVRWVGALM
jgi:hypothetical protein